MQSFYSSFGFCRFLNFLVVTRSFAFVRLATSMWLNISWTSFLSRFRSIWYFFDLQSKGKVYKCKARMVDLVISCWSKCKIRILDKIKFLLKENVKQIWSTYDEVFQLKYAARQISIKWILGYSVGTTIIKIFHCHKKVIILSAKYRIFTELSRARLFAKGIRDLWANILVISVFLFSAANSLAFLHFSSFSLAWRSHFFFIMYLRISEGS